MNIVTKTLKTGLFINKCLEIRSRIQDLDLETTIIAGLHREYYKNKNKDM